MSVISVKDEQGTQVVAAALARQCQLGDCILLEGELGAGKTSFARGFIGALHEGDEEVVSPSFMLLQTYTARAGYPLSHFDLYRLKSTDELREIGLDEALGTGITLVEWPERAPGFFPKEALTVHIAYGDNETARRLEFSGGSVWERRLKTLKDTA